MDIRLSNFISIDELDTAIKEKLRKLDEGEELILIDKNRPAFAISRISDDVENDTEAKQYQMRPDYALHEAMEIVLKEQHENTMHAAELADEIFKRKLYWKRDGKMAEYNQIRARVDHYPDMFIAMKDNMIKLKDREETPNVFYERNLTLHEAMVKVLNEAPDKSMTYKDLSNEIFRRNLYRQKAGGQAPPSQIRLRARNYGHLFEIISGNIIKLRD